jgi:hypothetical protein
MRGRHTLIAAGTGFVLGLLAIGPGLAPGLVLSYDMVFVPRPQLTTATFGLSRMLSGCIHLEESSHRTRCGHRLGRG